MTNRERVLATLNHEQPDKTPFDITFTKRAHDKMVQYYNDPDFNSKIGNCFIWLRPHPGNIRYHELSPDIWEDEFGVHWDRTLDKTIGAVCNQLVTPDNVSTFKMPNPDDPTRYDFFQKAIDENPDGFILASLGFSLFERSWTLVGIENILMAMAADKRFANTLFDRILEFNLRVIEKCCELDIDVFRFGDDWGQQQGLIMGPDLWREFIKPRIKQMYQLIKSKGKFVMIHSCGKIDDIMPDLIECGLDICNPLQPEVMDIFEVKKKFGNDLTFCGGISLQKTLPFGTTDQVKEEVKMLIDTIGKDGGYIVAPSNDTPADAKAENIDAMIHVLRNQ